MAANNLILFNPYKKGLDYHGNEVDIVGIGYGWDAVSKYSSTWGKEDSPEKEWVNWETDLFVIVHDPGPEGDTVVYVFGEDGVTL